MANEKRLIDVDAFRAFWNKNYRHQYANDNFLVALANFPAVDAAEVVRCCSCAKHDHDGATGYCDRWGKWTKMSDFCSYGERKDNG